MDRDGLEHLDGKMPQIVKTESKHLETGYEKTVTNLVSLVWISFDKRLHNSRTWNASLCPNLKPTKR
jgi:hypothetical protein